MRKRRRNARNAAGISPSPRAATSVAVPQNPQAISRYPLSPGEEERLRDEIVRRLIAMWCGKPERCANALCRRQKQCKERVG